MAISTERIKAGPYTGGVGPFPFRLRVDDATDITVLHKTAPDAVATVLATPADYSIELADPQPGGSITLVVALVGTETVEMIIGTPITQPFDPHQEHNAPLRRGWRTDEYRKAYDRLGRIHQTLAEESDRTSKVELGEIPVVLESNEWARRPTLIDSFVAVDDAVITLHNNHAHGNWTNPSLYRLFELRMTGIRGAAFGQGQRIWMELSSDGGSVYRTTANWRDGGASPSTIFLDFFAGVNPDHPFGQPSFGGDFFFGVVSTDVPGTFQTFMIPPIEDSDIGWGAGGGSSIGTSPFKSQNRFQDLDHGWNQTNAWRFKSENTTTFAPSALSGLFELWGHPL